ncbi:response regulator [Cohnella endophytica]|uniref:response regulator n=1 Tax=Cohnella endophytica TaxID=2419778 RepID=UPI0013143AC2|nr:response regulator [Cohnella endophytica]
MAAQAYRILVAEDNVVNLKLINRILVKLNHIPESAHNGYEVLQLLQHKRFDFILMDIQMPRMDGLETARHIIATIEPSIRPIMIAMTANAMKGDKEQCLEAGMNDYLSKPIIIKELEKKLFHWGEQRRGKLEPTENRPAQIHQHHEPSHIMVSLERMELLRKLQPNHNSLVDLFHLFFAQCKQLEDRLRHQFNEANFQGMLESSHSLRGACLNYGALHVAALCGDLEKRLHNKEWDDLSEGIRLIETSLELTTYRITEWIQAQA